MGEYDGDDVAVDAARILLSFQNRRLRRWPEWAPRPDEEPSAEVVVEYHRTLSGWTKPLRKRSLQRATPAVWVRAADSLGLSLERGASAVSGNASSGEDAAPQPPPPTTQKVSVRLMAARWSGATLDYVAEAGSGPSTSGGDLTRSRSRSRAPPNEKAHARTGATTEKDAMEVSSPETPLDYAAATGSGASSSYEEVAQPPRKRKVPRAGGSGGASSGDEGCSSPAKPTHLAAGVPAVQAGSSAAAKDKEVAVKSEMAKDEQVNRDDNGVLLFDLNEDPITLED
ncbi:hypothetical protein ABZP36_030253 [Zizania latifolia]